MKISDWNGIKHFTPDEFTHLDLMDGELIRGLDALRAYVDKPIFINSGYRESEFGYHPKGRAVDFYIFGMSVIDQFIAAQRFPVFTGIGIYPKWRHPGLHCDTRPRLKNQARAIWGCTGPGRYVEVTKQFLFMAG